MGASASAAVLPMNISGCFPLGFTGLISLLSIEYLAGRDWKHELWSSPTHLLYDLEQIILSVSEA